MRETIKQTTSYNQSFDLMTYGVLMLIRLKLQFPKEKMLCLLVYLADFVPHVFDMLFVSMSSHSMSKLDLWFNLFITGVQNRLDLQDLILRVVPSRVEMVATNCPPCKKCHGVADVLCVACDLRACIDCITQIHAVTYNIF